MNFVEFFNSNSFQAVANLTEVVGFSLAVATYVKTSLINKKLFKGEKMAVSKDVVFNTFAFDPKYTGREEIKKAEFSGRVIIDPKTNQVTEGQDIVGQIPLNPNKTFLVSKAVFDYAVSKGWLNVAMWDAKMTTYETVGDRRVATAQGGLIFGDEV